MTTSEQRDGFLLTDDFDLTSPLEISPEQVQLDINRIIHFLNNGYGGRKYVAKSQMSEAQNKLKAISQGSATIEVNLFCSMVDEALLSINDAHLMARFNGESCSGLREGKKSRVDVGRNIHQLRSPPWLKVDFKIRDDRVSIVSVSNFPKREDEGWKGFLDAVLDAKRNSAGIIIDLRGNEGGDDTMGLAMADYLYGQDHPTAVQHQIKSQTPETLALLFNNYQSKILRLRSKDGQVPDYLIKRRDEAFTRYGLAQKKLIPQEELIPVVSGPVFDVKKGYIKPIIILIDRDCASSCEGTLEAFESHPHVTTIGTNTGGFCHFGNMGLIVLPSSKVTVQMATDFWVYKDGRFVENVGYPPKVRLPTGQDALEEAKKLMSKVLRSTH